ncbi:hypothetical protein ACOMHN_014182 [Nucella lapillus]
MALDDKAVVMKLLTRLNGQRRAHSGGQRWAVFQLQPRCCWFSGRVAVCISARSHETQDSALTSSPDVIRGIDGESPDLRSRRLALSGTARRGTAR